MPQVAVADRPPTTPKAQITDQEIAWVRRKLAASESLADLAEDLEVRVCGLDQALWRRLGYPLDAHRDDGFQPIGAILQRIMPFITARQPVPERLLRRASRLALLVIQFVSVSAAAGALITLAPTLARSTA